MLYFNVNLFVEIAAETNRSAYVKENPYDMNRQSAKLPTLSRSEFRKEVTKYW